MAKKSELKKNRKTTDMKTEVKYKQITAEIFFTDGEIKTATFYNLKDILGYVDQSAGVRYVNSIRIELF